MNEITPDDLKTAGGVLVAFAGVLVTAIGFMLRTAFTMGKDASKVAAALDSLNDIKAEVAKIPIILTRLGTLENAHERSRSDIKHLLRGSRPDLEEQ